MTNVSGGVARRAAAALAASAARPPSSSPAARSGIFLSIGRDLGDGRLTLDPTNRDLQLRWDLPPNLPLTSTQLRLCGDLAAALGGRLQTDPFWKLLHWPITVHNLGGCPMGDDPADSVVDADGEVHGQQGLFVLDGAALPGALGANPSFTIAAVAERNVERYLSNTLGARFAPL